MIAGILLDEHFPHWWPAAINATMPLLEIRFVGGLSAPPNGTSDPDILNWLEEHCFLLLTNNRKSMPGHLADHIAAGRNVEGIFFVSPRINIRTLIDGLELVFGASLTAEFQNRILTLPL